MRLNVQSYLSVSEAARFLKVSSSTIQRLCNRGLIEFEMTQGGHRRIPQSNLLTVFEQLRGIKAETLFEAPRLELDVEKLVELLKNGAERELMKWLPFHDLDAAALLDKLENILLPAIIQLDSGLNQLCITAREMWLAVNTVSAVLERFSAQLPGVRPRAPKIIGGAIGGTLRFPQNDLGSRFVELGLRLCDYQPIRYRHVMTPSGLADAAKQLQAAMVWVGHTHIGDYVETVAWHRELAGKLPTQVRVLIGGGALSPSIRRQLPPHTYYESITQMVEGERAAQSQPPLPGGSSSASPRQALPSMPSIAGPHFRMGSANSLGKC